MSREDSIAALKRSGGDVDRALRAELGCFRIDARLLEELAWEYALSRHVQESFHACVLARKILM